MKKIKITIISLCISIISFAQVGIGTNTPVAGSLLELKDFATIKVIPTSFERKSLPLIVFGSQATIKLKSLSDLFCKLTNMTKSVHSSILMGFSSF
jgi:hypothetical protein